MFTHILQTFSRKNARTWALGSACVLCFFLIGIETAGEVQPVSLIRAGSAQIEGDLTGDGSLTVHDAIRALEIAEGYEEATAHDLKTDPNGDGQITAADALWILRTIANR
ncbi:MAG: dockerin type I repeat-containing protein [Candidatus Peregrinibacteria bacterium]